jgi:hypothetical protein
MALSPEWVDMIHTKLMLIYGRRFSDQYPGLDAAAIKGTWAHELSGMSAECIKWGLMNLPRSPFPPNVLEFRDICNRRAPDPVHTITIKGSRTSTEVRARLAAAARALSGNADPLHCAKRLREREQAGEFLSPVQRKFWRDALGVKTLHEPEEATHDGS